MTRQYGRIKTSIWADNDFCNLTDSAQALYMRLLSAQSMKLSGICDWRPNRIAMRTRGMTTERVREVAQELIEARYIVVDEVSEEVLVRSFVRHESVMNSPKTAAGLAGSFRDTASPRLRGVVADELRRLQEETPDLGGWGQVSDVLSYFWDTPSDTASDTPSDQVADSRSMPLSLLLEPEPEAESTSEIARDPDDDAHRPELAALCNRLADAIAANGSKRPSVTTRWLNECRLMIDKDGRTTAQIASMIRWCQADHFWKANILSMPTLREKYDQMRLQAERPPTNGTRKQAATTHIISAAMQRAQERDAARENTERKAINR